VDRKAVNGLRKHVPGRRVEDVGLKAQPLRAAEDVPVLPVDLAGGTVGGRIFRRGADGVRQPIETSVKHRFKIVRGHLVSNSTLRIPFTQTRPPPPHPFPSQEIRQIPAVGGVRITEGTALDAYGRLPYTVDVDDEVLK